MQYAGKAPGTRSLAEVCLPLMKLPDCASSCCCVAGQKEPHASLRSLCYEGESQQGSLKT